MPLLKDRVQQKPCVEKRSSITLVDSRHVQLPHVPCIMVQNPSQQMYSLLHHFLNGVLHDTVLGQVFV